MIKSLPIGKSISLKEMGPQGRLAFYAHRAATRKMRRELRQRGLPMIGWKNGKVIEIDP